MKKITKKNLEIMLENLETYKKPKIGLEQYETNPKVAAQLLFLAYLCGDIKEKKICDLGCGVGTLAIGASLLGAKKIYAVEVDDEAIKIAKSNAEKLKIRNIEWINKPIEFFDKKVDVALQNPPFGTKKRMADVFFLKKAMEIAETIYSIHKKGNIRFLAEKIKQNKGEITHIIDSKLTIPHIYPHHKKRKYEVEIQILRVEKTREKNEQRY